MTTQNSCSVSTVRKHFTHPDYGITICHTIKTVRLALHYIAEDGNVKMETQTSVYHSDEGLKSCMRFARAERDRLIAQPQFQAYIARKYTDPARAKGAGLNSVRPRQHSKNKSGLISSLPGLFMKLNTIDPKGTGREVYYLNVTAHGPVPNRRPKLRSWSVRKYGLGEALRLAAEWRNDYVGDLPPTEKELRLAEAQVRKAYSAYFGGD